MKTRTPRGLETDEQRGDRLRLEVERNRKKTADEESAVDRMIRDNIRLRGA